MATRRRYRRIGIGPPQLVGHLRLSGIAGLEHETALEIERQWDESMARLQNFLKQLQEAADDGLPAGAYEDDPETIQAGLAGQVGEGALGWSPGNHFHPISTGIPVGLGYEAAEGESAALARGTHVHPYLDLYEDLLASYRFEETSGDRYPSLGEFILTEFPAGGPIGSATGKLGDAVDLTGAELLWIDGDGSELAQGSFDYSLCFWAYLDDVSTLRYIVAKDASLAREYGVLFDPAGAGGNGAFQAFIRTTAPTTFVVEADDIAPATGTWYFIHYQYVHAESTIYLQINDGVKHSTYCNGETPNVDGSTKFFVGARRAGSPTSYFDGRVDALHWHQRALSDGEHDILFAGGDGRELYFPPVIAPGGANLLVAPGGTVKNASGISVAGTQGDAVCWIAPYDCEVIAVKGIRRDGTGATVNMRRNYTSEHLSSDLSLPAALTLYDGGAVQNIAYQAGDVMEARVKSVAGTPTEVAIAAYVRRT